MRGDVVTELRKTVRRVTLTRRREKSASRALVLSFEPGDLVGVRLQGTRQTFRLGAEQLYELAVRWHEERVARLARKIAKSEALPMRRALPKARKELAGDLK